MPLYEYRCDNCGNQFEVLQRLDANAQDLECPECGSNELAKQFSTFAANTSTGPTAAATASAGACFT